MFSKSAQAEIRSEVARLRAEADALEQILTSSGVARRGPGRPPKAATVSSNDNGGGSSAKRGTKAGSAAAKRIGAGMAKRWSLARKLHKEGKIKAANLKALKAYEAKSA
jgi:hypothetical protein